MQKVSKLPKYRDSIAGILLAAREAAIAPVRPALRAAQVTEQQWRVLRVLQDEGPLDVATLSATSMLHGPSVTRILRELGERGLTRREMDPNDRRRAIISVSPNAMPILNDAAAQALSAINGYVDAFGQARLDNLLNELTAFRNAITPLSPEGPPFLPSH